MRWARRRPAHLRRHGVDHRGRRDRRGADGPLFPVARRGPARLRDRLRPRGQRFAAGRAGRFRLGRAARRAPTCCTCRASRRRSGRARPTPRSPRPRRPGARASRSRSTAITARSSGSSWDSDPAAILSELVGQADILFGNHRDISLLLGRDFGGDGPERRREAAEAAFAAFPKLKLIASTARHVDDADTHRIAARIDARDGAAQTDEVVVAGHRRPDRRGRRLRRGRAARHAERPRPRLDGPRRPRADLPQAQPAGRCQPVRPRATSTPSSPASSTSGASVTRRAAIAGGRALGIAPSILSACASADVRPASGWYSGLSEGGLKVFRGIRHGEDTTRANGNASCSRACPISSREAERSRLASLSFANFPQTRMRLPSAIGIGQWPLRERNRNMHL